MRAWNGTYRLQLNASFRFADAAVIADYLAALGVSHVYLSPITQAAPGSMHGYDVVDPSRLSEDLGGEAGYDTLCRSLEDAGLGQVLDIVPNHMAIISPNNRWWTDVLANGASSRYAPYFDLAAYWREGASIAAIRLPILADRYGAVLEAGEICLEHADDVFFVRYDGFRLPLSPTSAALLEVQYASPDEAVATLNADGQRLHDLLELQHYRLTHWKTALDRLSYRRFFDINGLVGTRVEDPDVFRDSHALVLDLVRHARIDGLRIDHVDGLRDPAGYLTRLHETAAETNLVVEKILVGDEALPLSWPVTGTTGYEFVNDLNGLFVDPSTAEAFTRIYAGFTGAAPLYRDVLVERKRMVLERLFASDLHDLIQLFDAVCDAYIEARDWPVAHLEAVLRETIVALPVYRTYVQPERDEISDEDRTLIRRAITLANERLPDVDPALADFLADVLTLNRHGERETELVLRLQQLSGPAMAKGAEDTSFYVYNRLISLNEVGGDSSRFGLTPAAFHERCARVAEAWPRTMVATATHDTKRGEDTRLRIDALSEIPDAWQRFVEEWSALNDACRRGSLPDRNIEYLVYQTLAGAWPLDERRLQEYALKAARESKVYTSWHEPDEAYESALHDFIGGLLENEAFVESLAALVAMIDPAARVSSLSQTLIKLTMPGTPDLYQGTELWDHSLVDPDNRRPVDYERRRAMLAKARDLDARLAMQELDSGLTKLWLISRTLSLRRAQSEAFAPGAAYQPLYGRGAKADHLVAFARGSRVLTIAQRLVLKRGGTWEDTALTPPPGRWRNVFTDDVVAGETPLEQFLAVFPVALLVEEACE